MARFRHPTVIVPALVALVSSLPAQEAALENQGSTIVVAAPVPAAEAVPNPAPASLGVDLTLQQTPAAVSQVPADWWSSVGARNLDGVLPYVPGVNLTDNGGWTGDTISIRGFPAALTYRDGQRTFGSYGQGVRVMPDATERIEVVKGPAGAEFGQAEPGGSINRITKKPSRTAGGAGTLTVGEHGYRRLAAEATGAISPDGTVQGLVVVAYEEPPEWRDGRPDDTFRTLFAPSVNWDYRPDGNLLFAYERVQQSGPQDRGIIYLEGAWKDGFAPREWSFHQTTSEQDQETDRVSLSGSQAIGPTTRLRHTVDYQRLHYGLREFRNAESEPGWGPLYQADGLTWTGVSVIPLLWSDWEGRGDAVSGSLEIEQDLVVGATRHTVAAGVRGYRSEIHNRYTSYTVSNTFDIFRPTHDQVPEITAYDGNYTDEVVDRERALTARWLAHWKPQVRTVLAAQWTRFEYAYTGYADGIQDFADDYGYQRLPLRAAVSIDVAQQATVFAGVSDGYVAQSGIQRSGAAVAPIHDRSAELGVKLGDETLLWTTSAFLIRRDDISVGDPANTGSESFMVNAGAAQVTGVESEVVGEVGRNLDLRAGVALQRSRWVRNADPSFNGNQVANTPRVQAGGAATYRWEALGLEPLSTTLGVRYMGSRQGNSGNTITLPSYVLTDLALAWAFTAQTSLTLAASNLFDETAYTGMQDGNGAGADQVMVGDPRVVSLAARHTF